MLFDCVLPTAELLSKLKPINPLKPFQCFMNQFIQLFLSFQQCHSIFIRNRFLLRKPLSSFIHKKRLFICERFIMGLQQVNHVFRLDSSLDSSSLALFITSAVIYSTEALNPSKSSMIVGINFFQTFVNADIWTFSQESLVFLLTSRMVTPFQTVFKF